MTSPGITAGAVVTSDGGVHTGECGGQAGGWPWCGRPRVSLNE
jgi:hypothetical protein